MKTNISALVLALSSIFISVSSIIISSQRRTIIESQNKELEVYRAYYYWTEAVLFHCKYDSVPKGIYSKYLDALTEVKKYQDEE